MELSEILKAIRKEQRITQEDFAHAVHVSFSTVNRWENSKSRPTRTAKVIILDYCEKNKVNKKLINELKINQ